MLRLAIIFLIIALIAGWLGFWGIIVGAAAVVAKGVFAIFLLVFLALLIAGLFLGSRL